MDNKHKIFWNFIKDSGADCKNINKVRKIYKKKHGKEILDIIDNEYYKYHNFFQTKIDPVLNDSYDDNNSNYDNFFQHILSKGPDNFKKIMDKKYNKKFHTINMGDFDINYEIKETLFEGRSEYQYVQVFDTKTLGKVLSIDNDLQLSEKDEHKYHEMITHVPVNYFNYDINILIIGGGDGGVAREALKHPNVKKVTLVELDKMIVDVTIKYFPKLKDVFYNPKLELIIGDGLEYVDKYNGPKFDLIILDLTDFGQSNPLHTIQFYNKLLNISNERSLICFNHDNFDKEENKNIFDTLQKLKDSFKYVQPYGVFIPTFGGGYYSFCMFSNSINPKGDIDWNYYKQKNIETKYYSPRIHISSFVFPGDLENKLNEILKNKNSIINEDNSINQSISIISESNQSNKSLIHTSINIEKLHEDLLNKGNIVEKIVDNFIKDSGLIVVNTSFDNPSYFMFNFNNGHMSIYANFEDKKLYIDLLIFEIDDKSKINNAVNSLVEGLIKLDKTIKIDVKNLG